MLFFLCLLGFVNGHMGVTSPESRERPVVGDNYRFPGGGHCHGVGPGAPKHTYASGDTVTIQISSGAAHNGGHCALYLTRRSDNEQKWYKQMDFIDCTLTGNFQWKIEGSLVPAECKEACTLIWLWSPKSSGACEIYQNCFDVKITGSVGPADPSAVTITKNPTCVRIDPTTKQTPAFGEFCGTMCTRGTLAPTASAPTQAPPTSAPKTPAPGTTRCGLTWTDANKKCGPSCTVATESEKCLGGTKCFADMLTLCESDVDPSNPDVVKAKCTATGAWSSNPTITKFCADNCPDTCPPSHCTCDGSGPDYVRSGTTAYKPVCQKYTTVLSNETMVSIAQKYDLSSYQDFGGQEPNDAAILVATLAAAAELLAFNRGCDAVSVTKIEEEIPVGTKIFITGDCQLTTECPQPSIGAASNQYSSLFSLSVVLSMFLYHQL